MKRPWLLIAMVGWPGGSIQSSMSLSQLLAPYYWMVNKSRRSLAITSTAKHPSNVLHMSQQPLQTRNLTLHDLFQAKGTRSTVSERRNWSRAWKSTVTLKDEVELFDDAFFDPLLLDPPVLSTGRRTWGVFGWPCYAPKLLNKSSAPFVLGVPVIAHWRDLEPHPGVFDFEHVVTRLLRNATANNLFVFLMIWIVPDTPEWLYNESGANFVVTDRSTDPSTSQTDQSRFPDYSDPIFLRSFFSVIARFARFVEELPKELRSSILFVQAAEGSTGDGFGYKGDADIADTSHVMSRFEYSKRYRTRVWREFRDKFVPLGVAVAFNVNLDLMKSAGRVEVDWLLYNDTGSSTLGIKLGMFSHGYHVSHERYRRRTWIELLEASQSAGKQVFSRGEIDKEIEISGWAAKHVAQALYWSALYALHNYVDHWNVPQQLLTVPEHHPALKMFDRYAGYRDASKSDRAFIAFRRGLDATDKVAFPEATFGIWARRNDQRYQAIAMAHAKFGARLEDLDAVTSGAIMSRRRSGYNDVGWGILRTNFRRHLYQLQADATSTGLWHYPTAGSFFGRFARGLGYEFHKNKIDLVFHPAFLPRLRPAPLQLHIVYFDEGDAQWRLKLRSSSNNTNHLLKTVLFVTNSGTDTWQRRTVENLQLFPSAQSIDSSSSLLNGSDAALQLQMHPDIRIERIRGTPVAFHLLEAHKATHSQIASLDHHDNEFHSGVEARS